MNHTIFIDVELGSKSTKVSDFGALTNNGKKFHSPSATEFGEFISDADFLCGHNIFNHDLKFIQTVIESNCRKSPGIIDTLYLSPLLFPKRPYHHLGKDEKFHSEESNNPLNDCIKTKSLLDDIVAKFYSLNDNLKSIYHELLNQEDYFKSFFAHIDYKSSSDLPVADQIKATLNNTVCHNVNWIHLLQSPIELAYCVALLHENDRYSICPKWLTMNFPKIDAFLAALRGTPCAEGCTYCKSNLDAHLALQDFFQFKSFREYDGEKLQEKAVTGAIANRSLLAIFPTGGGKSLTFQLPALMCGRNEKALTVVISPLQSLMKDQVDNLEMKSAITEAVTINGLLDPIERSQSIERVANGEASILYISPESLRSRTIENLLFGRKIARFVIDEAHCFSSWGQDFRVDYLYIGKFIREFQRKKNLDYSIPVSCFTATAKQKVIEDICGYFERELQIDLEVISTQTGRKNLKYDVFRLESQEEKYNKLRDLIESRNCPSIVYVSRTKKAEKIAQKLSQIGIDAKPYHGKMPSDEKIANQNSFMSGNTQVMVATSAFGMGVDKSDIGMVVHYEISDSLENYVQEAGRAGRDEKVQADCYVLFNEDDLGAHFILLNQTKLNFHEIKKFWQGIKELTKHKLRVQHSALEMARKAGWNSDDKNEIETRVKTALAALEESKYIERRQNTPRIYADGILSKTATDAIEKIKISPRFDTEQQRENAVRIIKKLFSSRSRKHTLDEAETRIEYIADVLGIHLKEVLQTVGILREEGILADSKDLTAFLYHGENKNQSLQILETFRHIENYLKSLYSEFGIHINIKAVNTELESKGQKYINTDKIKTVLNFWAIKKWISKRSTDPPKNHFRVAFKLDLQSISDKLERRHRISQFIITYLFDTNRLKRPDETNKENVFVDFSILELKSAFASQMGFFDQVINTEEIEDVLFYLSRIGAMKIEDGFMVIYNKLSIERKELDNRSQYKQSDYAKLSEFYQNKIEQIHIVGEYARLMNQDYAAALQYVNDYFYLNGSSFVDKYFNGRKEELSRNLTPKKYRELFESLSSQQRKIIDDKSQYIVVIAGPGSGKTKVLVHKLASLIYTEDIKTEELLMLTFSRQAATEFKLRLLKLIGKTMHFVQINTFHGYAFDLIGKVGDLSHTTEVIQSAVEKIEAGEIEQSKIYKSVLVIDEAQDMDATQFNLVRALMDQNPGMRVIAVGDDDQNIYTFRQSDSRFMMRIAELKNGVTHELTTNFRSKSNLVDFADQFVHSLSARLRVSTMKADQLENGKIEITSYSGSALISPMIERIKTSELSGSTAILTLTNDDVFKIAGALLSIDRQVKILGKDDDCKLRDLVEVVFFQNLLLLDNKNGFITDDKWENAKLSLRSKYGESTNYAVCEKLISVFEKTQLRKYLFEFQTFVYESKWEDFYRRDIDTIVVSTIHKAKGKEFDNVYLMLKDFHLSSDEQSRREIYVAMTRAKSNLYVHENTGLFDKLSIEDLVRHRDQNTYEEPDILVMHLRHDDINLGYFARLQPQMDLLRCGQDITVNLFGCDAPPVGRILNFSQKFLDVLKAKFSKGYVASHARIKDMLFWKNSEMDHPIIIILPEIHFKKL